MNATAKVLVTAVGGAGHGEQILKALTMVPRGRYELFGADADPECPNFELVDKAFSLPRASDPDYVDTLLEKCRTHAIDAVFHGCEPELRVLSKNRRRFEEEGIFLPLNPESVIEMGMNKVETSRFLERAGFEPPRFWTIDDERRLDDVDVFPVVIKPSIGGGGSANCFIAQSRRELGAVWDLCNGAEMSNRLMVQEYCGTPDHEYTVGVLMDMDGELLNSIAVHRKLDSQMTVRLSVPNRTGRSEFGERLVISSGISHGRLGRYPEITGPCETLAKRIGARGALNIQCRYVGGRVKVFEINPRFSGTTSLRAMMGYNEPDILLRRHLLGEHVIPHFTYDEGTVIRGLYERRL